MTDYYTKEETDAKHEAMMTTITAEIQSVQSAMNVQIGGLATKVDLGNLESKSDDILKVFKGVKTAISVTEIGGKWSYRAILVIAALLVSLGIIWAFFKFGFAGITNHISNSL